MSLPLRPVQVRLINEAYEALERIAIAHDQDLGEALAKIATEALLGKGHTLKVLHERLSRAVKTDKMR